MLEEAGLQATDRFITTWNSRDPAAWAASLHYPHVRPSPHGEIRVANTIDDYIAGVDFQSVIDAGWDHSEWDYRHVLHVCPIKVHVAGQWSRYTQEGDVILTTPVVYICTKLEGNWGIQSRFGADYVDEDTDTTGLMTRGMNLVQDFVKKHNAGNRDACAELLNYPHFNIGTGQLDVTADADSMTLLNFRIEVESIQALQTGRNSMNLAVELITSGASGAGRLQGVVHLNERDNHLGIQAWSLLDPDMIEEN